MKKNAGKALKISAQWQNMRIERITETKSIMSF